MKSQKKRFPIVFGNNIAQFEKKIELWYSPFFLSLVPSHYLSLSNNHIATISLCLCLTRLISLSFYHTTFALYLQVIRIYHFLPLCPTHFLYLSITLLFSLSFLHTTLLLSSSQSTLDLFVSNSNLSFLHSVFIIVY